MPRIGRVVVPGFPHHVTQRGVRRQKTFFSAEHYTRYLSLLRWWAPRSGVRVWGYCLMPNHVHLVLVPDNVKALARCMGEVHQRYAREINAERQWAGHLWQARFYSTAMEPGHAIAAARYIAMNPVRAGLAVRPDAWAHSSASTHLGLVNDGITDSSAYAGLVDAWSELLASDVASDELERLRRYTRTGRPLGSDEFISNVEAWTGRVNLARTRGRPPNETARRGLPTGLTRRP